MEKRLGVYFVNTMHHLLEKSHDMNVFVSISISIFICHVIHTDWLAKYNALSEKEYR